MKRKIVHYFIFFLFLFICNLVFNHFLKRNLNIANAFSTAFGVSLGIFIVERWMAKKLN